MKIAKNLKDAQAMGVEHVADLLRQKLVPLLYRLDSDMDPTEAVKLFQKDTGLDQISLTANSEGELDGKD